MRKVLFLILSAFMMSTNVNAWEPIPLTVNGDDDNSSVGHSYPKSPIEPPTVYIENHTLAFENHHPDYALYIKDENDDVVYSTTVYSAFTLVVLPSTLSGDYKIEIRVGGWIFTGWINV